ncbi:MAG: 5'/3'-nucleotidase SurE [Gammaproteobacteria bacterium GWF2_41_13]|nr:MAG: 5'/3'-nucleotidase SurE [Gammaproteobacteria bacterium GWF2_41_13]
MKLLLSNDDGYQAVGIKLLEKTLSEFAEVIVVAPDRNRSGASNSLTLDNPLRLSQIQSHIYTVNGTPTDCVHLAVTGLLDKLPDMVISGINHGQNMGDDVLYSGTVAAAIEGRYLGLPSIAISLAEKSIHYETAAHVAKELVLKVKQGHLPSNTILNVNVPDVPLCELGKYEITRLGKRHRAQESIKQIDPRGRPLYWIGLPGEEADAGIGTDFYAIHRGNVSITPIELDWTNYKAFDHVTPWVQELNEALSQEK